MRRTLFPWCYRQTERQPRQVFLGTASSDEVFPPNNSRSQKYSLVTFLPSVLAAQFKFFLNLYLLAICVTQCFHDLRIGPAYTYYGPLLFVLCITLFREGVDEYRRYRRDIEINSRKYTKLTSQGFVEICSSQIKVSDLTIVKKNQTVPADMVFLRTTERSGTCSIKTDQLDGVTDWVAVPATQTLDNLIQLVNMNASIYAKEPKRVIDEFQGKFTRHDWHDIEEPLAVENTLWANTVVTSGTAVGCVIYTGTETRSMMNNNESRNKLGLLDLEVDV